MIATSRSAPALRAVLPLVPLLAAAGLAAACSSSTSRPERATAAMRGADAPAVAGSVGLGDPYYPLLGNGGYDALHYDLVLTVDPVAGTIEEGAVTMRALATQSLRAFNLDFHGLEIEEVRVDGEPARFDRRGDELTVVPREPIPAGAELETVVRYRGTPTPVPDPSVPGDEGAGWWHHEDEIYVVSEPSGARSFYPVNDHPTDKATYGFRITVPKPYVVAANGLLEDTAEDGERITYVWRAKDPTSSYLVTLAIGKFDVTEGEGPGGLPLHHYFAPGTSDKAKAAFDETADILAFFTECFGPYPFESAGGIVAGARIPGALETQTIPVYGRGVPRRNVIAHELAHQWFGDAVTLKSWPDIWLNEGFAQYAATLYGGHVDGREKMEKRLASMYRMIQARELGPPTDPGVERLFSGRVYVRGAWVLRALHVEVGDETFFRLLRTYFERYRGGAASTEDFLAVADEVAGPEAVRVARAMLYDAVVPPRDDVPPREKKKERDAEPEASAPAASGASASGR